MMLPGANATFERALALGSCRNRQAGGRARRGVVSRSRERGDETPRVS